MRNKGRKKLCALCEISFAVFAVKLQINRKERKEGKRKVAQRKERRAARPCQSLRGSSLRFGF
jgi:hypothetical protein